MQNHNTSQQILPTASNLIGFCLIIITSLHVTERASSSMIDEFTSFITLGLSIACLFSFVAMRSTNEKRQSLFELIAEYSFMFSLLGILIIILMLVLGYLN